VNSPQKRIFLRHWRLKESLREMKKDSYLYFLTERLLFGKQMRAEREKRATIAESEGDKQARINRAEGTRQEMIENSQGEKQKRINEAEGRAAEIEYVALATAKGIREIASAINAEGGLNAVNLRIAEQYINEFGKLAGTNNSIIVPSNLTDVAGTIASAMTVIKGQSGGKQEQPAG